MEKTHREEFAKYGGYELAERITGLSRGALYNLVSRRKIPHFRLSPKCVRFREADLVTWMEISRVEVPQ